MKHTYSVYVGNVGNLACLNWRDACRTFTDYVKLSKTGCGRAGHEPVQLFKNGEPVKEFDPWAVVCRKGSFREAVWKILRPFLVNEFCRFDLVSYTLTRSREIGWEVNDAHFMCAGLEARQALHAICERYKVWKANYCPDARVKDLVDGNADGDHPILEVKGIPFMEIRVS